MPTHDAGAVRRRRHGGHRRGWWHLVLREPDDLQPRETEGMAEQRDANCTAFDTVIDEVQALLPPHVDLRRAR